MYRKRWMRIKDKTQDTPSTPRSKTRKQMRGSTKTIRKALLFQNVLVQQLKSACKKRKERKTLRRILSGNMLKKYHLKTFVAQHLGIGREKKPCHQKGSLSRRLANHVHQFFERDDVSRLTTGAKRTLTKHKIKHQKRILNDTIWNLHKKCIAENKTKLGYSTFCRLRPFWIVPPTEADRDTCCCKKCENVKFLAEALYKAKIIKSDHLNELLKEVVCSTKEKTCMYGQCNLCNQKQVQTEVKDQNQILHWKQWKTVKEDRVLKGGEKKCVTLTVKEEESGAASTLVDKFHDQMWLIYRRHCFNICNQLKFYKSVKESLSNQECFIHVDFAENYVGKMSQEIQSMHFGASKPQITLHTGYYTIGTDGNLVTFCGVSDSLQHDPASIWAFMTPVLREIKDKNPSVDHVHIFSDGPTSQYRQKVNFYLLSTEIFELGFTAATWNFHEAGHGKGIPDGIGGALKRDADRCVHHGADIMNATTFVSSLQEANTSVHLYIIHQEDINEIDKRLKVISLKTVPGTMRLHQVVTKSPGQIQYRDISCSCSENPCNGHNFKDFSFVCGGKSVDSTKPKSSNVKKHTADGYQPAPKEHTTNRKQEVGQSDTYYKNWLEKRSQECQTFAELQVACSNLTLDEIEGSSRYILEEGLSVDDTAIDLHPADVPGDRTCFPVTVRADGDCLPASGSVFAFGHDNKPNEIRTRIVAELSFHKDYYLRDNNLLKGMMNKPKHANISKTFAMYSDEYVAGVHLTPSLIETIFENEVMKICKPKSYMGIWQLFGLASVLHMPIYSVYPQLGNPIVRADLHRLLKPRVQRIPQVAYIMWSSTRRDMMTHWVPNHFLPVLQPENKIDSSADMLENSGVARQEQVEMSKNGGEALVNESDNQIEEKQDKGEINVEVRDNQIEEKCDEGEANVDVRDDEIEEEKEEGEANVVIGDIQMEGKKNEGEASVVGDDPMEEKIDEGEANVVGDYPMEGTKDEGEASVVVGDDHIEKKKDGNEADDREECDLLTEVPCPNECLGRYVVVLYDGKPYPGYVEDSGYDDVYVECMAMVGRKHENNCFFWPKKIKDKCWYLHENILAVIPEPTQKEGSASHFEVNPKIWKEILEMDIVTP